MTKMYQRLRSVTLMCFLMSWTYAEIIPGACNIEPLECCTDYRRVANRCEECWPGSYGPNCNFTCPMGFYGRLCMEQCNCLPCNNIFGCRQNSNSNTADITVPPEEKDENVLTWWIILVAVGLVVVGIPFGYFIYKKCSTVDHPSIYFHAANVTDRNASEQNTHDSLQKKGPTKSVSAQNSKDISNVYIEICGSTQD